MDTRLMRPRAVEMAVRRTVRTHQMLASGDRVLAAVSGGPDSVALLCVLKDLMPAWGLDLFVASFDHGVRRGSKGDVSFVRRLAAVMQVPFFTETLMHRGRKRKLSEDFLRCARYDFLIRTATAARAQVIALGHTRDDQAETILMRLLRGSGLWGLSGVLPVRMMGEIKIVRPLIDVSRKNILDYLRKKKMRYRTDETNGQDIYLRNKIRRKLLPLLERDFNPGIRDVLVHTASSVGADYEYLSRHAADFLKDNSCFGDGKIVIREGPLKGLDVSLRRLVMKMAVGAVTGRTGGLSFRHVVELDSLLGGRPLGSESHLPGGVVVSREKNGLKISKR